MTHDFVISTALGKRPDALHESVSLSTPLTLSRIAGRDRAVSVLRRLVEAFGVREMRNIARADGFAWDLRVWRNNHLNGCGWRWNRRSTCRSDEADNRRL